VPRILVYLEHASACTNDPLRFVRPTGLFGQLLHFILIGGLASAMDSGRPRLSRLPTDYSGGTAGRGRCRFRRHGFSGNASKPGPRLCGALIGGPSIWQIKGTPIAEIERSARGVRSRLIAKSTIWGTSYRHICVKMNGRNEHASTLLKRRCDAQRACNISAMPYARGELDRGTPDLLSVSCRLVPKGRSPMDFRLGFLKNNTVEHRPLLSRSVL